MAFAEKLTLLHHRKKGFYLYLGTESDTRNRSSHYSIYSDTKPGRFACFIRGQGTVTHKESDFDHITTETEFNPNSFWDIKEVAAQYGPVVANEWIDKANVCAGICVGSLVGRAMSFRISREMFTECAEKLRLDLFACANHMIGIFGRYHFDLLAFDEFLRKHHGYAEAQHGSISHFMVSRWGTGFEERFRREVVAA